MRLAQVIVHFFNVMQIFVPIYNNAYIAAIYEGNSRFTLPIVAPPDLLYF